MIPVFMRAENYLNRKTGMPTVSPVGWLLSEKYDGQRAQLDIVNHRLVSRSNNIVNTPPAFMDWLKNIPYPLDGELYLGYGNWDLTGIFRSSEDPSLSPLWKKVTFMVFDIADPMLGDFATRRKKLEDIFAGSFGQADCPIKLVPIKPVLTADEVKTEFDAVIARGGEGLILNCKHGKYQDGKSSYVLKYKKTMDEEAVIVGYKIGSTGLIGSFVVFPIENGVIMKSREFSIAGLTNEMKQNYQRMFPIGTQISYRCFELSKDGKPKHPVMIGKCRKILTSIDMILQPGRLNPAMLSQPSIKKSDLIPPDSIQIEETMSLQIGCTGNAAS
jgi:DNA ligase-1